MAVRYLYRATRTGEANSEGDLLPKDKASSTTISDSIENGTASKYIHCTKNRFVALYFAEEYPSFGQNTHEIVCIDLSKIERETKVLDVSMGVQRLSKTAWNYACKQQIVLLQRSIPKDAIVARLSTSKWSSIIKRNDRSFDDFVSQIPMDVCLELDKWAQDLAPPVVANPTAPPSRRRPAGPTIGVSYESEPFSIGQYKYVHHGRYTLGPRAGHPVVVKLAKEPSLVEDAKFWRCAVKAVEKASDIVKQFNRDLQYRFENPPRVRIMRTKVWDRAGDGCKLLVEPYINSAFAKFTRSGYKSYESTDDLCNALSHFSYYQTGGKALLCGLQGGAWSSQTAGGQTTLHYVLTDVVVLSDKEGTYGETDIGPEGVENFVRHCVCGKFCNSSWPTCRKDKGETAAAVAGGKVPKGAAQAAGAAKPQNNGKAVAGSVGP